MQGAREPVGSFMPLLSVQLPRYIHEVVFKLQDIIPMSHSRKRITLENAQHCGASLTEYTRRTWSSYMHDCHQNVTEPQATENHIKQDVGIADQQQA